MKLKLLIAEKPTVIDSDGDYLVHAGNPKIDVELEFDGSSASELLEAESLVKKVLVLVQS